MSDSELEYPFFFYKQLRTRVKALPAVYSSSEWENQYADHRNLLRRLERPLVPLMKPLPNEFVGKRKGLPDGGSPRFSTVKQIPLLRPHQLKKLQQRKKTEYEQTESQTARNKKFEEPKNHPIESPSPEKYQIDKK
eukprot:861940_1